MIGLEDPAAQNATPTFELPAGPEWTRHDFVDSRGRPLHVLISDGEVSIYAHDRITLSSNVEYCHCKILQVHEVLTTGCYLTIDGSDVLMDIPKDTAKQILVLISDEKNRVCRERQDAYGRREQERKEMQLAKSSAWNWEKVWGATCSIGAIALFGVCAGSAGALASAWLARLQ